jgi:hypothetical protein
MSRYQPVTFLLSSLTLDVGAEETRFLAAALSSAVSRDKLRLLYVHRREGRDIFVNDDTDTFGALGEQPAPASQRSRFTSESHGDRRI